MLSIKKSQEHWVSTPKYASVIAIYLVHNKSVVVKKYCLPKST